MTMAVASAVPDADEVLPAGTQARDPDAWLACRRTGIGGSDISALVGMSSYAGPLHVWADKLGLGHDDAARETEAMRWGTLLQPVIAAEFAARARLTVVDAGTYRNREQPWMLANPDGLCDDGAGLEIKLSGNERDWSEDELPAHAELQSQWCMAVTGLQVWHVAALLRGRRLAYRTVRRRQSLIDYLISLLGAWWKLHVVDQVAPSAADVPLGEAWLDEHHPAAGPELVAMERGDWLPLRQEWRLARQAVRDAEARLSRVRADIKEKIGNAAGLAVGDDRVVSWLNNSTFRSRDFAVDHPDVCQLYLSKPSLDLTALRAERPDLYGAYRARALRIHDDADEDEE